VGRVLVVDDEQSLRDALEVLIAAKGHAVRTAANVEQALGVLNREDFDLVVTDLRLEPGGDGMDVVQAARRRVHPPEVIVMTAFGTREKALLAHELGALFYLEKGPHLSTDLRVLVAHAIAKRALEIENESLRDALVARNTLEGIVGRSEAMLEVFELVARIAPTRANVLIVGESGTGKERIARVIHHKSDRAGGPLIPLNCGAIPENLIESELFGHERGAFTGADAAKGGLFDAAHGGTIFLDEIGELPIALQPKLLRVLQERRVKPVGATAEHEVDVRVIAATNRDLESEVKAGRFREDLYFRLNVVQIDLPPLRERPEDVPLLAHTFLEKYAQEYRRPVSSISPRAMERLLAFAFPGNVRQLENVIERAVALATTETLTEAELPKTMSIPAEPERPRAVRVSTDEPFPDSGVDLDKLVDNFEFVLISRALEKAGGVKTRAAELLGLSFRQFRYKLAKHERTNPERGL